MSDVPRIITRDLVLQMQSRERHGSAPQRGTSPQEMRDWLYSVVRTMTEAARGYLFTESAEVNPDGSITVTGMDMRQYRFRVDQVDPAEVAKGRPGDFVDRLLQENFPH